MDETEKDKKTDKRTLLPFVFATLFVLPSCYWLGLIAVIWLRVGGTVLVYIGPLTPLFFISTLFALALIFVSWVMSPRWCRFVLILYSLIIIIWFFYLLNPPQGTEP